MREELQNISGMFTVKSWVVTFKFVDRQVRLTGQGDVKGTPCEIEFWMHKSASRSTDSREWERLATCGSRLMETETGREIRKEQLTPPMTAKDVKDAFDVVRDGWREYIRDNPETYNDAVRVTIRWHMQRVAFAAEAAESLMAIQRDKMAKLEAAHASDDPETALRAYWRTLDREDSL